MTKTADIQTYDEKDNNFACHLPVHIGVDAFGSQNEVSKKIITDYSRVGVIFVCLELDHQNF